jgi:hypothetical protein
VPLTIKTTGIEDYLDGGEANIKALILGAPSSGKTRSASYWPRPIFADCEKGRMSIADRGVPYGEITSQADMKEFVRRLQFECMKPVRDRAYQTAVIDTFDSYQKIVIAERLKETKKDSFSGWEDWGYLDTRMTNLLTALVALPMNIVINVHVKERSEGDDGKGPTYLTPRLKGDVRDSISEAFDLIGLMQVHWEAVNGERTLTRSIEWHPRPDVPILKDRSGRLPKYTPVNFSEDDYAQLFTPLIEALDDLKAGQELETLETDTDRAPEPVAPHTTGAVAQPAPAPAKKAPAKKAVAPAARAEDPGTPAAAVTPAKAAPAAAVPAAPKPVPPAKRPTIEVVDTNVPTAGAESAPQDLEADVPAAPGTTTPVDGGAVDDNGVLETQPVQYAVPAGAPSEEEAVANVLDGIPGSEVIDEQQAPDEDPPVQDDTATPVVAETAPAAPQPGDAKTCGTPGNLRGGGVNDNPVPGCGKSLADEKPDLVNISLIKTTRQQRPTYLCPACMAAFAAAS